MSVLMRVDGDFGPRSKAATACSTAVMPVAPHPTSPALRCRSTFPLVASMASTLHRTRSVLHRSCTSAAIRRRQQVPSSSTGTRLSTGLSCVPTIHSTGIGGWPVPLDATKWPVIRVDGSVTLAGGESGQGLIVVTGDLTIAAPFDWKGVILVGRPAYRDRNGACRSRAPSCRGSASSWASLLTRAAAARPPPTRSIFSYHSCNMAAALARFGHLH